MERIVKGIWIPIEIWQDTDLSWNEKILLMEIDSFTSKGKDCHISNEYIAELLGVSTRWASQCLSHLVDLGYVKVVRQDGRARYLESTLNYFQAEWKKTSTQIGRKLPHTYNNRPNKDKDESLSISSKEKGHFSFFDALMEIGVTKEVANAWLQVRKAKRAVNTEVAFNRIKQEISKTGLPANECITIAVANSWQGFQASWVANRRSTPPQTPPHKESVFEHNLRVVDEMFGTNLHEQNYGNKKADIDEQ